jgi:hypothetical protein
LLDILVKNLTLEKVRRIFDILNMVPIRLMLMGRPNWSQITKQAGFIESVLSGKVHHPQRAGPEKSHRRNGSPVFL